jgi:hypothetical protein
MFGRITTDTGLCTVDSRNHGDIFKLMNTIFPIHSAAKQRPLRETEHEYFVRMAREHARTQRRARRERVLRKLTRRPSAERRAA